MFIQLVFDVSLIGRFLPVVQLWSLWSEGVLSELLEADDSVTRLLSQVLLISPVLSRSPARSILTDNEWTVLAEEVVEERLWNKSGPRDLNWSFLVKLIDQRLFKRGKERVNDDHLLLALVPTQELI